MFDYWLEYIAHYKEPIFIKEFQQFENRKSIINVSHLNIKSRKLIGAISWFTPNNPSLDLLILIWKVNYVSTDAKPGLGLVNMLDTKFSHHNVECAINFSPSGFQQSRSSKEWYERKLTLMQKIV